MDNLIASRSMLADAEENFLGNGTLSIETAPEYLNDGGIHEYVTGHTAEFLSYVNKLPAVRQQDFLISYYLLLQEQGLLGNLHGETQTVCSQILRASVRVLCSYILFNGDPTVSQMSEILLAAGLEDFRGHSMAALIRAYIAVPSFAKIARANKIRRPDLRREFKRVATKLGESTDHGALALSAYLLMITKQKSVLGTGDSRRAKEKLKDIKCVDSDILGHFTLSVTDRDIDQIFPPRRAS
jgi:hypothetical protein